MTYIWYCLFRSSPVVASLTSVSSTVQSHQSQWRGQFWAAFLVSCSPRTITVRSSLMFFIQVLEGYPGGCLQFSWDDENWLMALIFWCWNISIDCKLPEYFSWQLMWDMWIFTGWCKTSFSVMATVPKAPQQLVSCLLQLISLCLNVCSTLNFMYFSRCCLLKPSSVTAHVFVTITDS